VTTAQVILALGWLGLIILGLVPGWGARFGLWLRGDGDLPLAPPPNRSLSNRYSGDPREDADEKEDSADAKRLDRYV
jgi:hypothetical protein